MRSMPSKRLVTVALFLTLVVLASIYLGRIANLDRTQSITSIPGLTEYHTIQTSSPTHSIQLVTTSHSISTAYWSYASTETSQTVYVPVTTVTADFDYQHAPSGAYHYTMYIPVGQTGEFRLRIDPKYSVRWYLGEVPSGLQALYHGTVAGPATNGETYQVWTFRPYAFSTYTLCFTSLLTTEGKSQAGPWVIYLHLSVVSP